MKEYVVSRLTEEGETIEEVGGIRTLVEARKIAVQFAGKIEDNESVTIWKME